MARILKFVAVLVAVLGAGMLVQVVALDTGEVDRSADLGAPADEDALLGIDLAGSVAVGQHEPITVEGNNNNIVFDGPLTVVGDITVEGNNNNIVVNGPLTVVGDIVFDKNNNNIEVDGDVTLSGEIVRNGNNNNIDADEIEEGADVDPPGSGQTLLTVTNQAGTDLDVTVALEDPTTGDLSQGGASGSAVSFGLAPGDSETVEFVPDPDLDAPVTVEITATGAGETDPLTVELFRTVPVE